MFPIGANKDAKQPGGRSSSSELQPLQNGGMKMSSPTVEDTTPTGEDTPQPAGIVERLVRDDVDRKRFLRMVGGAGATSFGAFVLAACGSSKTASTASTAAAPATSTAAASSATG